MLDKDLITRRIRAGWSREEAESVPKRPKRKWGARPKTANCIVCKHDFSIYWRQTKIPQQTCSDYCLDTIRKPFLLKISSVELPTGVSVKLVKKRLNRGWKWEEAITFPNLGPGKYQRVKRGRPIKLTSRPRVGPYENIGY